MNIAGKLVRSYLCLTPKEPYGGQTPGFPGGGGGMEEDGGKRPSAPRFSPGMRCVCCWRWTEMKHEQWSQPNTSLNRKV